LAIVRSGPRLLDRLFDADERDACADGADLTAAAALFGIKESVVKVAGGLPTGASYRDVHVQAAGDGGYRPVRLTGELGRWADTHGVETIAGGGTLTDDLALAWAFAC
jgi:phosphopantetheinyl transferase (holo-ACP synthase)